MTSKTAITVRLDATDRRILDTMKHFSGSKADSKAFLLAVSDYVTDKDYICELELEVKAKLLEIERLCGILEKARGSALALIEDVSQEDMF